MIIKFKNGYTVVVDKTENLSPKEIKDRAAGAVKALIKKQIGDISFRDDALSIIIDRIRTGKSDAWDRATKLKAAIENTLHDKEYLSKLRATADKKEGAALREKIASFNKEALEHSAAKEHKEELKELVKKLNLFVDEVFGDKGGHMAFKADSAINDKPNFGFEEDFDFDIENDRIKLTKSPKAKFGRTNSSDPTRFITTTGKWAVDVTEGEKHDALNNLLNQLKDELEQERLDDYLENKSKAQLRSAYEKYEQVAKLAKQEDYLAKEFEEVLPQVYEAWFGGKAPKVAEPAKPSAEVSAKGATTAESKDLTKEWEEYRKEKGGDAIRSAVMKANAKLKKELNDESIEKFCEAIKEMDGVPFGKILKDLQTKFKETHKEGVKEDYGDIKEEFEDNVARIKKYFEKSKNKELKEQVLAMKTFGGKGDKEDVEKETTEKIAEKKPIGKEIELPIEKEGKKATHKNIREQLDDRLIQAYEFLEASLKGDIIKGKAFDSGIRNFKAALKDIADHSTDNIVEEYKKNKKDKNIYKMAVDAYHSGDIIGELLNASADKHSDDAEYIRKLIETEDELVDFYVEIGEDKLKRIVEALQKAGADVGTEESWL